MTDMPPSRYKIVEKDGRLIVYDKGVMVASGKSKPPSAEQKPIVASWATASKSSAGAPDSPSAKFGRLADMAAAVLSRRRKADGTLVIQRTKKEGLRSRTKEATLTTAQARNYGMSLLSFAPFVLGMILTLFGGEVIGMPLLFLGLPLLLFGVIRMSLLFDKLDWRELGG